MASKDLRQHVERLEKEGDECALERRLTGI